VTPKQKNLLVLSVVLSIVIWGFFYGFIAGTAFTLSLLFHEYGHYYWMGREGIKNKTMMMIPPFGAIAIPKEPWSSLGAEARIALAGPGFGLVSAVALLLTGVVFGSYKIKITTFTVCLVNLFNFWAPIAILDGGRVIKPLLLSLNTKLGIGFYYFSFVASFLLVWNFMSLFTLIIGFLIIQILESDLYATRCLIANNKIVRMSGREAASSILLFLAISAGLYAIVIVNGVSYGDFMEFMTDK